METSLMIKIGVIVGVLILGLGSRFIFKMREDNAVEEVCEEVIQQQSGIDIDLSPLSQEK